MPETVEIRVHGVSGTAAESLLEISSVVQVGGDDTACFMRQAPVPPPAGRTQVEAFHWGTMTSGSVSKALWLLMAPFGIVNLARFTLPMEAGENGGRDRVRAVADVSLRLIGLVMTGLLVTTVAFVSIDLVAWQCGGASGCQSHHLSFFGLEVIEWRWRLLLGMAVPAAMVALLGIMSAQVYLYASPGATSAAPDPVGSLGARAFWSPSPRTALLRRLHLSTALAVVAMLVAHLSTHEVAGLAPAHGWPCTVLWVLFWLSAAIVAWCAVITGRGRTLVPSTVDAVENPRAVPNFYRGLTATAWLVFVAVAVIAAGWGGRANRPRGARPAGLTGFDWAFHAHFAAAALFLLVLVMANAVLRGPTYNAPDRLRPMWCGMACSVLTGFAVLLAAGFTAGAALQSARLLGWADRRSGLTEPLDVPVLFNVTALLWGLLAFVLLAVAVVVLVPYYQTKKLPDGTTLAARIQLDYPDPLPERTMQRITTAWQRARLKYRLPHILLAFGSLGGLAAVVQGTLGAIALIPGRDPGYDWIEKHIYGTGRRDDVWRGVEVVGTWALTALAALLVLLGARAFRSPGWRRSVGVLWDLLAFWPRLTHPIVPPPYGGHAVLSLARRTEQVIAGGRRVVLSGHSQGSVICAAVALTVETPTAHKKMAMITHGSQLLWAYSRLFPAYLGHNKLTALYTEQLGGRWRNVHRWTDYLGGPVLARPATGPIEPVLPPDSAWVAIDGTAVEPAESDESADGGGWLRQLGPEYQLRDPFNVIAEEGAPVSPLLAHSAYYADPAYDRIVEGLLQD
ncbi:hypothetical protein OOK29_32890 [Streptomyces phaeochromogenes]|uniref:hypothetical protein n=1 Tax=Streptomyces phaeochromogenes TaxID=1923 RepID=UPI00225137EB|nr:hypothetical protein [Streptomyces phaeochromogenes]MCX5602944.1 hypothetical protein [Streptomyces phaeochromogenes]